jgi:L-threonylcarbamoyladenylate synthase
LSSESLQFATAVKVINQGGVIAYPTEACFGLGCAPQYKHAIERLRTLKTRSAGMGFILVSDNIERLKPYINWYSLNKLQRDEIVASWPGPTSWLIPVSDQTGSDLCGENDTLAVRVSAFESIRLLCSGAQSALISTSANLQGKVPITTAAEVAQVFGDNIDYIVDSPVQGLENPSRIIDARTQQIIRP